MNFILALFLIGAFAKASPETGGFSRNLSLGSSSSESIVALVEANRTRLKSRFSRKHIGIEILVAQGSWNQPESLFGHAMIRLLDEDADDLNDTVVTFAQLTLDENAKYTNGLNGGYDVFPSVQSLLEALVTYSKADSRAFRRFIIPATPELILNLKKVIFQVSTVPRLLGDYKFATNNCLTSILRVFKEAGFPIYYDGLIDIPGRAEATLRSSFLLYYPAHEDLLLRGASRLIEELRGSYEDGRTTKLIKWIREKISLPSNEKSLMFQESFWTWVDQLDDRQLKVLRLFWPLEWQTQRARLDEIFKSRTIPVTPLEELVGLTKIPLALYQNCFADQSDCERHRLDAALLLWGNTALSAHHRETLLRWNLEVARNNQLSSPTKEKRNEILQNPLILDLLKFSETFKSNSKKENL